jgi:hypothetical protein
MNAAKSSGWLVAVVALSSVVWLAEMALAQGDANLQLWADYHSHYYRSEQKEWYADAGLRVLPEDFAWAQAYVRPSLRFHRRTAYDAHAGVGAFYTYNEGISDVLELRPWQGVKFRWPILTQLTFSHYFRLEERFSFSGGRGEFALRFRYKLSTRIALRKAVVWSPFDPLFMPISVELFADAGPKVDPLFGSRGRFDIGLGYTFSDDWVGELHLIAQASRSGLEERLDTTEYILRLQLKHLFEAKDYRKRKVDLPD